VALLAGLTRLASYGEIRPSQRSTTEAPYQELFSGKTEHTGRQGHPEGHQADD